MTDDDKALVERMGQTLGEWLVDEATSDWWEYQRDHMKARDRIEALITENKQLVNSLYEAAKLISQARADAQKLEAENERLREALEKIVKMYPDDGCLQWACAITARAALGEQK